MDMAHLPSPTPQSPELERFADAIGAQMAQGALPMDIARRLHPKDRKARLAAYMRIRRAALSHERVTQRVQEDVKLMQLAGLGPATRALVGRASRGRVDAIKLLFEASGFHNPRVQHDHSGDINIRLTIPRPDREPKAIEGTAVDADVVED